MNIYILVSTSLASDCFLPIQLSKDVSIKLYLENILTSLADFIIFFFLLEALYDEVHGYFPGGLGKVAKKRKRAVSRCSRTQGQTFRGKKSEAQEIIRVENVGRRVQTHYLKN